MRRASETVGHRVYSNTGKDQHGNPVEAWAAAVDVGIYAFDPGSTSEPRAGDNRVTVDPTIYGPYDMPFTYQDKVIVRGDEYQVQGVTRRWRHPSGNRPGAVVSLKRVEG